MWNVPRRTRRGRARVRKMVEEMPLRKLRAARELCGGNGRDAEIGRPFLTVMSLRSISLSLSLSRQPQRPERKRRRGKVVARTVGKMNAVRKVASVHTPSAMPSNHPFLFRTGTLVLAFCAILNAQIGMRPKLPPPRTHPGPYCINCVRDLSGQVSRNPAPVRAFRSSHPCPATGSVQGPCAGYVVGHIKALNRGGSDTPENMRWQTIAQAIKGRIK